MTTSQRSHRRAVPEDGSVAATVRRARQDLAAVPSHRFDDGLRTLLGSLGAALDADTAQVLVLDACQLRVTHEWRADGSDARPPCELPATAIERWQPTLRAGSTLTVTADDADGVAGDATGLAPDRGWSTYVPLVSFRELLGLLRFDGVRGDGPVDLGSEDLARLADDVASAWVRREARSTVGRAQARLEELLRHVDDVLLTLDPRGVCTWSSTSVSKLGIDPARLVGLDVRSLLLDDDEARVRELVAGWRRGDTSTPLELPDVQLVTPLGIRWITGSLRDLRAVPGVEGDLLTIRDVTERKHTIDTSRRNAMTDPLTRLLNRSALRQRITEDVAAPAGGRTETLGVLFLDIDRFRLVNDVRGAQVGDDLLRQAAGRLGSLARSSETVARYGGDTFVVLLREPTADTVALAAERFGRALAAPYYLDGATEEVTASMGLRLAPAGVATDVDELLRDADTALFVAKERGRDRLVVFDPAMAQVAARRSRLTARLRDAVEGGRVRPMFQPIVDLRTMRTTGVEALARWQDDEFGVVSPGEFIPLAEETGLIQRLGMQMLSRSASTFAVWPDPLVVSVNVSARQLEEPDLAGQITALLRRTGMPAARVRLEVTESLLMRSPKRATVLLDELRSVGLTVALDDFGTGHSSLAVLRDLPLDVLKIDRSFVSRMHEDGADRAMVETIIGMARHFGLQTVAEGVEEQAQADLLRDAGCDYSQGWLHGRAVPAEDLASDLGLDAAAMARVRAATTELGHAA